MEIKEIRAIYDQDTIRVYQAYNDKIADAAVAANSFQAPLDAGYWSKTRMTWIKPSKVWMAYRCGWTETKEDPNQSRVLALDLSRSHFENLLLQAKVNYKGEEKKKKNYKNHPVIIQWDPERFMDATANNKTQAFTSPNRVVRSIQIGLRGSGIESLLDPNFVIRITDVTQHFSDALRALKNGDALQAGTLLYPDGKSEQVLDMSPPVMTILGMAEEVAKRQEEKGEENNKMITANSSTKKSAIVVLGSAANPPHQGHLFCLSAGRRKAEELGYEVLWGTIAIAPSAYVEKKMKNNMMRVDQAEIAKATSSSSSVVCSNETRLHLLRLLFSTATTSTSTNTTTKPSTTHQEKNGGIHTRATSSSSSSYFKIPNKCYGSALECGYALRPSNDTAIIIVVGGDRAKQKWRRQPKGNDIITVCCPRNQSQLESLQRDFNKAKEDENIKVDPNYYFSSIGMGPTISSTMIRTILDNNNNEKEEESTIQQLMNHGYSLDAANLLLEEWKNANKKL